MEQGLLIRQYDLRSYVEVYKAMAEFTEQREMNTQDELWHMQHESVFTLGLGGKQAHVLNPGNIPVVKTDRGGQVTYHGPGQLLVYFLIDLRRKGIPVKQFVYQLEQAIIDMCYALDILAERKPGAPGVYVEGKKIAALGIRVRRGCCYHGLALNVDMDLAPYLRINPCGYPGLQVTQLSELGNKMTISQAFEHLLPHLANHLGYTDHIMYRSTHLPNYQAA